MDARTLPRTSWKKFMMLLKALFLSNPKGRPFPTILMVGDTGIGKNTTISNLSRTLNLPLSVVNLSGAEPADIQGLPYQKDGVHRWTLPYFFTEDSDGGPSGKRVPWIEDLFKDLPEDRLPSRILLMDELLRVHQDAFNPLMNFILDHVLHGHRMGGRPLILAAANMNLSEEHGFQVNELDDAQRARLRMIEIRPDLEEWTDHARMEGVHEGVIAYVEKNQQAVRVWNKDHRGIDLRTLTELGVRLAQMPEREMEDVGDTFTRLFVPPNVATPLMIEIRAEAEAVKPKDVLQDYEKVRGRVQKLVSEQKFDRINHICEQLPELLTAWDKPFEVLMTALAKAKREGKAAPERTEAALEALKAERSRGFRSICLLARDIPREIFVSFLQRIGDLSSGSASILAFASEASEDDQVFEFQEILLSKGQRAA